MVSIIAMVPNENWTRIEISEALSLPSNHSMVIATFDKVDKIPVREHPFKTSANFHDF